jgi:hypothetical protein
VTVTLGLSRPSIVTVTLGLSRPSIVTVTLGLSRPSIVTVTLGLSRPSIVTVTLSLQDQEAEVMNDETARCHYTQGVLSECGFLSKYTLLMSETKAVPETWDTNFIFTLDFKVCSRGENFKLHSSNFEVLKRVPINVTFT